MQFDFDKQRSLTDYVTIPAGTYLCRVEEVRAGTTRAGDERWSMKLVVAGQDAVSGKAKGALPRQPAEDFCVGHDTAKAVGLYGKLIVLQGTVSGLSVTTP